MPAFHFPPRNRKPESLPTLAVEIEDGEGHVYRFDPNGIVPALIANCRVFTGMKPSPSSPRNSSRSARISATISRPTMI